MRQTISLIAILVLVPCCVLEAQTNSASNRGQSRGIFEANQDAAELEQSAILLTPIARKHADTSLINDICKTSERRVRVYRFRNVAVEDAAQSVNQWLKTTLKSDKAKVNGFICNAPVIIVPGASTNSLIVSTAVDFAESDALEKMIRGLDQAPTMIQVSAVLKKTVDGKTTTVASPRLLMLENVQGSITFGGDDEQYTIELIAQVVSRDESLDDAPRAASNSQIEESKSK